MEFRFRFTILYILFDTKAPNSFKESIISLKYVLSLLMWNTLLITVIMNDELIIEFIYLNNFTPVTFAFAGSFNNNEIFINISRYFIFW